MKAKLERTQKAPITPNLPFWLVVDEKITKIPSVKGKDGRVYGGSTEKSQRCNIAIIDYQSVGDAELIAKTIVEALEKL